MKQKTEQEALITLTALCASSEHCSQEMLDKMTRWQLPEEEQARVMEYLVKNNYIDEERFTHAFVMDKIRYNKWGRRKIEQALWQKRIPKDIQTKILDEIDENEYLNVLRPLLKSKRRCIQAKNDYELNMKLIRFALSRGFTFELIRQCIDRADEMNPED
ncbi:MAG: RecX family transcriptional regulator [Prevotella sp.]|nr:RecX family transcriptional regulator [Prevotella sp.]